MRDDLPVGKVGDMEKGDNHKVEAERPIAMRIAHRTIIRRIETRVVVGLRGRTSHPVVITMRWGRAPG